MFIRFLAVVTWVFVMLRFVLFFVLRYIIIKNDNKILK